jgi:GT2 family glycosyltransferase
MMGRVDILCVNYYTERHVVELLKSLRGAHGADWRFIVVDNGSDGEGRATLMALAREPSVKVITPPTNLGYYGGAQFALDTMSDVDGHASWTIVCNPDIRFSNSDFWSILSAIPSTRPLVVAPSIATGDGDDQNPFIVSIPTRRRLLLWYLICLSRWTFLLAQVVSDLRSVRRRMAPRKAARTESRLIFAGHGSFLCFSGEYFRLGLNLRNPSFLYGEEIAIAVRCQERGVPIVYMPRLVVSHLRHASTGKYVRTVRINRWQRQAALRSFHAVNRLRRTRHGLGARVPLDEIVNDCEQKPTRGVSPSTIYQRDDETSAPDSHMRECHVSGLTPDANANRRI